MLSMGLMPLGSLPTGVLATTIGTAYAIALWGLIGTIILSAIVAVQVLGTRRADGLAASAAAATANAPTG